MHEGDGRLGAKGASLAEHQQTTNCWLAGGVGYWTRRAAKAQAIVEYRTVNSGFSSADQIVDVSGIGTAIYEKNKADILVK